MHRALRENLHRALSAYVAAHPARTDAPPEVRIVFGNSHQEILTVDTPAPSDALPSANGDDGKLIPVDRVILEVIRAMKPGELLPAEEIAQRGGYSFGGWFKSRCARLAKKGLVASVRGVGYGPQGPQ